MGITNRALSFALVATIFSLLVFGCAGTVATSESLGQAQETSIGPVLVAPDGRTLYTYDKDDRGVSNSSGLCAAAWPPLLAPDSTHATDSFTVITRSSGDKQWAYNGQPLYLYIGDSIPGDVDGNTIETTQTCQCSIHCQGYALISTVCRQRNRRRCSMPCGRTRPRNALPGITIGAWTT